VALQDSREAGLSSSPVVRDNVILTTVRANFVRSLSKPDLLFALGGSRLLLSGLLCFPQTRSKKAERRHAILMLTPLVLDAHHQTRGLVGELNGALRDISVLAACSGPTTRLVLQIPRVEPKLRYLGLRENRDRNRTRVDAAPLVVRRNSLPPVASGLRRKNLRGIPARRAEDEKSGTVFGDFYVKDSGALRPSRRSRTALAPGLGHLPHLPPPGFRR
jgi:hypothetical protein